MFTVHLGDSNSSQISGGAGLRVLSANSAEKQFYSTFMWYRMMLLGRFFFPLLNAVRKH